MPAGKNVYGESFAGAVCDAANFGARAGALPLPGQSNTKKYQHPHARDAEARAQAPALSKGKGKGGGKGGVSVCDIDSWFQERQGGSAERCVPSVEEFSMETWLYKRNGARVEDGAPGLEQMRPPLRQSGMAALRNQNAKTRRSRRPRGLRTSDDDDTVFEFGNDANTDSSEESDSSSDSLSDSSSSSSSSE